MEKMEDLEKDEDNQDQPYVDPDEIKRPTSFLRWIENYWYHYKWHTIVGAFFAILLISLITQIASKEKYDLRIMFSGDLKVDIENSDMLVRLPDATAGISEAFEQLMTEDYNGDGKKNAMTYGERLISPERQKELLQEAKDKSVETNEHWVFLYSANDYNDSIERSQTLLITGEAIICLMDSHSYELYSKQSMFARLEDVLGYKPEEASDEYSVLLKKTEFGEFFAENFEMLPDDTRLCIRKKATVGVGKKFDKVYDANVDVFKKVFAFSAGN
ncbi:MAG: hypothetical protein IJZ03_03715 [Clostridia bacterium]|nr:hypothetical protein [Clostridia bacterium]MBQ9749610.1 hypothetical protein [Clostridia bacterium]